ncbi:hypothetical protein [Dyadobacter frigoris]|uniref:BIG2 domain-containing protein n=1 Tax=Dyadobacter frigoris TaxID=2576211 RepID=A0A4U6CM07_9BACT|nr:hypothetical protein [Dyadobacter frigoris]TKT85319.1 hypothetical protein FDK13_33970 [Dyadobacter frigoris]GLU56950.1 hypothetical protein Dfri01_64110 [Dyadobacter frigoris]
MNTRQRSLRITSAVIFLFTLLSGSSAVLAQVKIGTNPTTINAANNLEVEASTAGRSVSVDKTTGKVKIADGSEGNAKVLTSDANGVATWIAPSAQDSPVLFSVSNSTNQSVGFQVTAKADFGVTNYDKNNNFNLTTDEFTVPSNGTGVYQVSTMYSSLNVNWNQGTYVFIYVNGVLARYISIATCVAGVGLGGAGTIIMPLTAGDVVDLRWGVSGQTSTFFIFNLSVSYISK